MSQDHVDVLIVGAGLSGIGAAHHLRQRSPGKTFAILEAREQIGGTWDLFRYPGIRSDSDMHTLGYNFRPWTEAKSIADGDSILRYIRATASEGGIESRVRFGHRVVSAAWSSAEARWTVQAERVETGETVTLTCGFLFMNSGYYRYDEGYTPEFPGRDRFGGEIVHPQHWPEDLDYAGKRVVVIGSGATAVTLLPAMAERAAKVTMLQRSPTYVISMPGEDALAINLRKVLPEKAVYAIVRWKNVTLQSISFRLSRRFPRQARQVLRKATMRALPAGYDVDTHFNPSYNPWEQRLCLVPDSDLFKALRSGRAEIVTDQIESFTEGGIALRSGAEIEADVIVTATGLNLQFLGGMAVTVDGAEIEFPHKLTYKGVMLSDLPNLAYTMGYTNASWTLKADLSAEYVCRLLNHMDATGQRICTPRVDAASVTAEPLLDFNSGYVLRALEHLPKQGSQAPWKLRQNYPLDLRLLRHGEVDDGVLKFTNPAPAAATSSGRAAAAAAA